MPAGYLSKVEPIREGPVSAKANLEHATSISTSQIPDLVIFRLHTIEKKLARAIFHRT